MHMCAFSYETKVNNSVPNKEKPFEIVFRKKSLEEVEDTRVERGKEGRHFLLLPPLKQMCFLLCLPLSHLLW